MIPLIIGLFTFVTAAPVVAFVLLWQHARREEKTEYKTIVETPTTPIAQVQPGAFVELKGRAVRSEQGLVTSPVSGREVLAFYVDIQAAYSKSRGGISWQTKEKLRDRRDFWLDDGSGKRAWVTPHEASAILPEVRYGGTTAVVIGGRPETVVAMTPELEAWARQRTGETNRRHCVVESVIEEGAQLYLLGWSYEEQGVPVLRSHPPNHALMLSTFDEAQLLELLERRSRSRSCILVGAIVLALVGLLLMIGGGVQIALELSP